MNPNDVIKFWFEEIKPSQWFEADPELDRTIQMKFGETHACAIRGELYPWRSTPLGRLAEILVLDQFSRNIYRGYAEAYAHDQMALTLAQEMVLMGMDKEVHVSMRPFIYMPYMHSESRKIHEEAVKLFSLEGMEANLPYEMEHKRIIDEYGYYPARATNSFT